MSARIVRRWGAVGIALALFAVSLWAPAAGATHNRSLYGVHATGYPERAEFERMAGGGVRWVRLVFPFRHIEPRPGEFDWSRTDRVVEYAVDAGVRILPVLYTVPPWVSANPNRAPVHSRFARHAWRRYVVETARRYGRGGSFWASRPDVPYRPIRLWQASNEPNVPFYWGGPTNVRKYVQLLGDTRWALRRADRRARVMTAGLFRYKTKPNSLSMAAFLKRFYRHRRVKRWFDVLAVHPYSRRPAGVSRTTLAARKIMREAGDGRTPIWLTEFGWSTSGKGWAQAPFRARPHRQAKRLRWTYRLLRKHRGARPGVAFWHAWRDFGEPDDLWFRKMGLFRADGSAKPSWRAYARIAGGKP